MAINVATSSIARFTQIGIFCLKIYHLATLNQCLNGISIFLKFTILNISHPRYKFVYVIAISVATSARKL
jgi:hypothetical protein